MKKFRIKYLLFFITVFCFSNINVSAQKLCSYGEGTGKNWKRKITLDLDAEVPFYLADNKSPLLTNSNDNQGFQVKTEAGAIKKYSGTENKVKQSFTADVDKIDLTDNNLDIYYNLDKKKNGECLDTINVAYFIYDVSNSALDILPCTNPIGFIACFANYFSKTDIDNFAVYSTSFEAEAAKFLNFKDDKKNGLRYHDANWSDYSHKLILEENKDKDPAEYDSFDCQLYSDKFEEIRDSVKNNSCDNNPTYDRLVNDINQMCENFRNSLLYSTSSGTRKCQTACTNLRDNLDDVCKIDEKSSYCGSLGNGIVNWIFKIIRIIRYTLPPVMIILSILDFIKAISEDDDSKMKDATKRFFRRLIAVALLFIIPFIIDFILHMFNIPGLSAKNPFCSYN